MIGDPPPSKNDSSPCSPKRIDAAVAEFKKRLRETQNYELIYKCYYRRLERFFARRRVFSPEEREDLTQESLWRVYKGLRGFRGQASFTTWCYGIASNHFRRWLERQTRIAQKMPQVYVDSAEELDRLLSDEDLPFRTAAPLSPDEVFESREWDRKIVEAIGTLPERMQQCVELRVQGLRYREIAEVMQINPGAVGAHLAQARTKLEHLLANDSTR